MLYETLNALRYSKIYDQEELGLAAKSLSDYPFDVSAPKELLLETSRLSVQYNITIYDASYLALSEHLNIPFFTADDKLLKRVRGRARHISTFSK